MTVTVTVTVQNKYTTISTQTLCDIKQQSVAVSSIVLHSLTFNTAPHIPNRHCHQGLTTANFTFFTGK
jgi:hypothetical protein